jgi:hypothetical protein
MKYNALRYIVYAWIAILFSCKKEAANSFASSLKLTQEGTITVAKDTTTVSFGDISVRINNTSTCFPSTEIFSFTVIGPTLPAGAFYQWSFGDGNTAKGINTTYSYQAAGSFLVSLFLMQDENTQLSKLNFPIKVNGKQTKIVPSFTTKSDFPANLNFITFNSTSSVNQGDFASYRWDWGDSTSSLLSVPLTRHEFPTQINDKVYPVKLTVTTNTGCKADTTIQVTVPGRFNNIRGNFIVNAFDQCKNEYFMFTAAAENVPGGSVYEWDFSDGKGIQTGNPIRYQYKFPNDYDVIMIVKLNGREIYRTNKLVNAKGENPKPTASFEQTLVWQKPTEVRWSFNSRSTIPTSTIDSYQWNFGNGVTNNTFLSYIENTYAREATDKTYRVQLIVTGNGCADTAFKQITIPKF